MKNSLFLRCSLLLFVSLLLPACTVPPLPAASVSPSPSTTRPPAPSEAPEPAAAIPEILRSVLEEGQESPSKAQLEEMTRRIAALGFPVLRDGDDMQNYEAVAEFCRKASACRARCKSKALATSRAPQPSGPAASA